MKIKLKKDFTFIIDGKRELKKAGDTLEWNDDGAKRLIEAGVAEEVTAKKDKGGDKK